MIRKLEAGFLSGSCALALGAASANAQAPSWSIYQGYENSTFVPFKNSLSSAQGAQVYVQVGTTNSQTQTQPMPITMDTGSIGLQVTPNHWNPVGLNPIGAGSIFLNSSGVLNSGYFYSAPVNFFSSGTSGSPSVATANVPVLVVTQQQSCPSGPSSCTPVSKPDVFYMGVGFNRTAGENLVTPNRQTVNGQTLNPFLNITQIAGQAVPASTIRQGYIINTANGATGGVTLGLTPTNTQGMSLVKLSANASASLDNWNTAPMSVTVTPQGGTPIPESSGANPPSGSGVLPDAGINYMFLSPVPSNVGTQSCTLSGGTRTCLPNGVQIQVSLPGNGAASALAQYKFTVGGTGNIQPAAVATLPGSPFVNTGSTFFLGFQYLYDSVGGYVGYAAQPALQGQGSVTPGVALIGQVDLPHNFSSSLPVFLIGDTTLAQTGSGSITGAIEGAFGLTIGSGSVTLGGTNTYTGGTTINAGTLSLATRMSLPTTGALTVNGGTLDLNGNDVTVGSLAGAGGTIALGANTLTVAESGSTSFAGTITGTGGLTKTGNGLLNLMGVNTYTGPTSVTGGRLAVNGSITSDVTVGPGGSLGGAGTIFGNVVNNGTLAPGNSIGTLAVNGSYTQAAGSSYTVEANAQGQADRLNVSGAPGTATIAAGTSVFVAPAATGSYAPRTTYTILNASGGVTGTYSSVASALPFLLPSLSYDTNNVYLSLQIGGFGRQAQTPNQAAVGAVLDAAALGATGDLATVLGAFSTMSAQQGVAAMNAISGQNYSGFSSAGIATTQVFMTNFANTVGGTSGGSNRVALAEACDVACDTTASGQWGAWGGALGGFGVVGGTANAGTLTYSLGGFAAGIDRRVTDDLLVGVTAGFTRSTQWVGGFSGRGISDTFQAGLYASYAKDAVYVDGLAAYAYSDNQMQRQITLPGLSRIANGRTGANLFFGQVEAGYRFEIGGRADAYVTPFARLQAATATQAAFTESGAGSLDLSVASQSTNSLRSVLGAQLGGAMDLGWREKLAMQVKLGWGHEYADTGRPVTASFVGAPALPFTTYGAAPQRDSVVLGLSATTAIADATSVYFRYEGNISNQDSNQALTAGFRMTW